MAAPSAAAAVDYETWKSDVDKVIDQALPYIQERIQDGGGQKQALVLDIDNTSLETYFQWFPPTPAVERVLWSSPATRASAGWASSSDIICTVTSVGVGDGPVLQGERLRPHVHINAIGADLIGKYEVPRSVLKSAFVTRDHRGQALREGECQQLDESDLGPELPELCAALALAEARRDGTG
ncbi:HAD family acid phosphatase [Streptomyces sp. NPDC059455]|uniref:HAD family acid phosphatase n=1 Tax=Streptomyces sp. NPDC059455 TaxID=3346837 RepID=UPI0036A7A90E